MNLENIFILPELVRLIASHLSQSEISRCVRVSKSWHAIFIPNLWRTFSDETDQVTTWGRELAMAIDRRTTMPNDLEWYMDVYRRHAPYIRHLTIYLPAILEACVEDAFAPLPPPSISRDESITLSPESSITSISNIRSSLTNLESLTIKIDAKAFSLWFRDAYSGSKIPYGSIFKFYYSGIHNENTPVLDSERPFLNACQKLILCNPRLRSIVCPTFSRILQEMNLVQPGLNTLKSLNHLSIFLSQERLPLLPSSITTLTASCNFGAKYTGVKPSDPEIIYERLETFDIRDVYSEEFLHAVLIQAPSLKSLTLSTRPVNTFGINSDMFEPIPKTNFQPATRITVLKCPQLQSATFTSLKFKSILKCFPLLAEYYDDDWIPTIAPLLPSVRPSRTLESPVEDSLSILLSSLPRLRVLNIPNGMIVASVTLEKPWICMDLEELSCQIVRLPYMTQEEEYQVQEILQRKASLNGNSEILNLTSKESRLLHLKDECTDTRRAILSQISKMTSLKYLSLSPDLKNAKDMFYGDYYIDLIYKSERDGRIYFRYNKALPDTLHLRLDCGLDQLASLTRLEYFGFESIDHRMEACDIEWIASHFLLLKEMRGLSTDNYLAMEPDPKIEALLAQIKTLRPFVKQGQSFEGFLVREKNGSLFSFAMLHAASYRLFHRTY
ncbi:hypothetical protein FBU30_007396 [Linnemannia zychae]|nr:hypothetical protein FBU30_007396 [Linnemannia zychae]